MQHVLGASQHVSNLRRYCSQFQMPPARTLTSSNSWRQPDLCKCAGAASASSTGTGCKPNRPSFCKERPVSSQSRATSTHAAGMDPRAVHRAIPCLYLDPSQACLSSAELLQCGVLQLLRYFTLTTLTVRGLLDKELENFAFFSKIWLAGCPPLSRPQRHPSTWAATLLLTRLQLQPLSGSQRQRPLFPRIAARAWRMAFSYT